MDPVTTSNQYTQPVQPQNSFMSRIFPSNMPPRTKKLIIFSLGGLLLILIFIIPAILQSPPSPTQNDAGSVTDNKAASRDELEALDQKYHTITRVGSASEADQFTINAKLLSYTTKNNITTFTLDLTKGILTDSKSTVVLQTKADQLPVTNLLPIDATLAITCAGAKAGGLVASKECAVETLTILDKPQKNLSYLDVAKTTYQWLTKQRNASGVYQLGQICDPQVNCTSIGENDHSGLAAMYATYHLAKADTKNSAQYLTTLRKDLATYTKLSSTESVLGCLWLYDLQKDTAIPTDIKQAAAKICLLTPSSQPAPAITNPDEIIGRLSVILSTKTETLPLESVNTGTEIETAAVYASNYATQALWAANTGSSASASTDAVTNAKVWYAQAVSLYEGQTNLLFHPAVCTLGIASLSMYQATQQVSYRTFAQNIATKINLGDECSTEISPSQCGQDVTTAVTCADFLHRLQVVTPNTTYVTARNMILDFLIQTKWDEQGYPGGMVNDHAFYGVHTNSNAKVANAMKPLQENAIVISLLAQRKK